MNTRRGGLTQADMVLASMHEASGGTLAKVPYEEIVLVAWKLFPQSFGLRNHPEFPDSSDIHKRLYQTLIPGGHAVSLGNKVFRLTEKGQARAAKLTGVRPSESVTTGRLSRAQELFFKHAKGTRAFRIWCDGAADELVDYDARLFFQFGPTASFDERKRRLAVATEALEHARALRLEQGSELLALSKHLAKTFASLFVDRGA